MTFIPLLAMPPKKKIVAPSNGLLTNLYFYHKLEEDAPSRLDAHGDFDLDVESGTVTAVTGKSNNGNQFASSSRLERSNVGGAGNVDGLTQFSCGIWVYPTTDFASSCYMGLWDSSNSVWLIGANANKIRLYIADSLTDAGGGDYVTSNSQILPKNNWHFVGATYDEGDVVLYHQGAAVAATTTGTIVPTLLTAASTADFEFGACLSGTQYKFIGILDEDFFYKDRVLGADDFSAIYAAGAGLFYDDWD